jgi:outer membrane receptor protein involved in Fe transport
MHKYVRYCAVFVAALSFSIQGNSQSKVFSGTVVDGEFKAVPGAVVEIRWKLGMAVLNADERGEFSFPAQGDAFDVDVRGKNIQPLKRSFTTAGDITNIQLQVSYVVPPISESVTITADALTPQIEFRNQTIYKNNLFSRDDQLIQTLNAGINAGQHEGGGKSLEIRRYGFNADHGGANGGLKILVDNVQQNQGSQAHGQGYLGSLKSLSPELVEDVSIINGPFSAAYGDFSGLGVVQIRQRESLPQLFTARVQGGSFNSFRGFFAYSPQLKNVDAFIAYEPSYTDGPFINKLRYRRDNITGNLTYKLGDGEAIGVRFNFGRNEFTSSGQIPLDLVASGELDRFGFVVPGNGGNVRLGTAAGYFRKEFGDGSVIKADAFTTRSLLDLYTNFTFFKNDPVNGDRVLQHDSRLQEGGNFQFLKPYRFFGNSGLFTAGTNVHLSQINVALLPAGLAERHDGFAPEHEDHGVKYNASQVNVNNYAGYVQNEFLFLKGKLRLEGGLRFDTFTFTVDGMDLGHHPRSLIGNERETRFQPKAAFAFTPSSKTPLTFYVNYGRGISSQDARSIVRDADSPKLATTDFYQTGASFNGSRISAVLSGFFIDRSNEQVYVASEGTVKLAGRSRSYGIEARTSIKLNRHLSFNGGLTNVVKAFYPGEFNALGERSIILNAPKFVSNAGIVLDDYRGFHGSLTWRHVSRYRLDAEDRGINASGNDVVDLAISKRLNKYVDLNFAVDNLLNKRYYETQNYFESRTCPSCTLVERIHGTPGFPIGLSIGATFRFGAKD